MNPRLNTTLQCPLTASDLQYGQVPDVSPWLTSLTILTADELLKYPKPSRHTHTMGHRLDDYVRQRIPMDALKHALERGGPIYSCGIPAELVETHLHLMPFEGPLKMVDLPYNHRKRARCARRPCFYHLDNGGLVMAVHCGQDYIQHMTAILRHAVGLLNHTTTVHVIRAHALEEDLCTWTNFDDVIQRDDIVLYGYASDLLEYIQQHSTLELTPTQGHENFYYYSERYALPNGNVLCFYECKHHGWGNLSAKTMARAARCGASSIFYIAKGATCRTPQDIYNTIACPTSYITTQYTQVTSHHNNNTPHNPLVQWRPALDTGLHLSLPTVMEEDLQVRQLLTQHDVVSLDNEAAQIARAIAQHNTTLASPTDHVSFAALQFLTDYIRHPHDQEDIAFDLVNNHDPEALKHRRRMMRTMFQLMDDYLHTQAHS